MVNLSNLEFEIFSIQRLSPRLVDIAITSDQKYLILISTSSSVDILELNINDEDSPTGQKETRLKVITNSKAITLLDNRSIIVGTTYASILKFDLDKLNGEYCTSQFLYKLSK